jgi:hypothetical protein
MAVTPALTYPSARRIIIQGDAAAQHRLLYVTSRQTERIFNLAATPRFLKAQLFYRPTVTQFVADDPLRYRLLTVVRRRQQMMSISIIRIRTFPIPYLSGGTSTRPDNGEQWPRFAVFGSKV